VSAAHVDTSCLVAIAFGPLNVGASHIAPRG
jgi:hypothetical protein